MKILLIKYVSQKKYKVLKFAIGSSGDIFPVIAFAKISSIPSTQRMIELASRFIPEETI